MISKHNNTNKDILINTDNLIVGQSVIYYPFKFEIEENPSNDDNREIFVDVPTFINYDTYIKYVDEPINQTNNKYSRSIYTVSLIKNALEIIKKPNYFPDIKENNLVEFDGKKVVVANDKEPKSLYNFYKLIYERIEKARVKVANNNKNKKELDFTNKYPVYISKINVVLYKKTKIGFIEIYLDYHFKNTNDFRNQTICMNVDAGETKKLLFANFNSNDYIQNTKQIKELQEEINRNYQIFKDFLLNLRIKEHLILNEENNGNILFNCTQYKKRAYAFSYYLLNNKIYESYKKRRNFEQLELDALHLVGRSHGSVENRSFNTKDVKHFILEDDTTCKWCITKVSFGTIGTFNDEKNYNYMVTALDEQHVLLYEMCLHQRFYLYTVIDKYRTDSIDDKDYYALKAEFADNITRYNLSMVSEVETQEIYKRIREQMSIPSIVEDANDALEKVHARNKIENQRKVDEINEANKKSNNVINLIKNVVIIVGGISFVNQIAELIKKIFIDEQSSEKLVLIVVLVIAVIVYTVYQILNRKLQKKIDNKK